LTHSFASGISPDFFPEKIAGRGRDALDASRMKWLTFLLLVAWSIVSTRGADAPVWSTENFGGDRRVFEVARCRAFVVLPPRAPEGRAIPWVWYAPTIQAYPNARLNWLFTRLIEAGIAVAGIDVGETYANPEARERFWTFYREAKTRFRLAEKVCLLAQSRGGLNHYLFATQHPEAVRCIAGIYPVMDLRSYPGLPKAAAAYHISEDELAARLSPNNPIDRLDPLARAGIPILHLHGDRDKLVPLAANSAAAGERYRVLGGEMTVVTVTGKGHEEVPEFFESPVLLEFLLRQARRE
jgi:pimeloyl-ACP methyl ester carboxylesterase